jgi:hypothetical protein
VGGKAAAAVFEVRPMEKARGWRGGGGRQWAAAGFKCLPSGWMRGIGVSWMGT